MTEVDDLAVMMFSVDWPKDDWSRFKVGDAARNRYVEMAKAAILHFRASDEANRRAKLKEGQRE